MFLLLKVEEGNLWVIFFRWRIISIVFFGKDRTSQYRIQLAGPYELVLGRQFVYYGCSYNSEQYVGAGERRIFCNSNGSLQYQGGAWTNPCGRPFSNEWHCYSWSPIRAWRERLLKKSAIRRIALNYPLFYDSLSTSSPIVNACSSLHDLFDKLKSLRKFSENSQLPDNVKSMFPLRF